MESAVLATPRHVSPHKHINTPSTLKFLPRPIGQPVAPFLAAILLSHLRPRSRNTFSTAASSPTTLAQAYIILPQSSILDLIYLSLLFFSTPTDMKIFASLLTLAAAVVMAAPAHEVQPRNLKDDSAPHQDDPNFISAVMRAHWYWRRLHCAQDLVWDANLANAARHDIEQCPHEAQHVRLTAMLFARKSMLTLTGSRRQQPFFRQACARQLRRLDRVRTHRDTRLARGGDQVPLRQPTL